MRKFITIIFITFLCMLASCRQSSQTNLESNSAVIKNGYSIISVQPEYDLFDISLDSKNRICYADKNKIVVINDAGENIQTIEDSLEFCTALVANGDNIYAWDSANSNLKKFGSDGELSKEYHIESGKIRKMDVIDNLAILLYQDKFNANNSNILLYNMKDNSSFVVESDRVISFTPYKDKRIIYCSLTNTGNMEFYEFDTTNKKSVKIYEEPMFLSDICYSEPDDAIYYCDNETLYKLSLDGTIIKQQIYSFESKTNFNRLYISNKSCFLLNSIGSYIYMIDIGNSNKTATNTLKILSDRSGLDVITKFKKATKAFMNSTSDIDIIFECIEGSVYYQTLKTRLMANDSDFDIFLVGDIEIDTMVKNYAMLNLNSYKEITEPFGSMFEGVLDNCTYNGILAGVPIFIFFNSWGVNDELLKTLKIECPPESWTWYDFYDLARKARKDMNSDGIADTYIYQYPYCTLDWVRQYNCAYFNPYEGNAAFGTDEFTKLMEISKKLKEEDLISIGLPIRKKTDNILFYDSSFSLNSGNKHYISPPSLASKRVYPTNMSLLCVNRNSQKQNHAVKFLSIYISKEIQIAEPTSALYKDISTYNKKDELGRDWDLSNQVNYSLYENIMKYAKKQFYHPEFNAFQTSKIREFLDEKTSMESAIDAIQQKANIIVGE